MEGGYVSAIRTLDPDIFRLACMSSMTWSRFGDVGFWRCDSTAWTTDVGALAE